MANAAQAAAAPPAPAPIQPLEADRLVLEGQRNQIPAWLTLRDAKELDRLFENPGAFLRLAGGELRPMSMLHITDDRSEVYTSALILMVRQGGAFCDLVEIGPRIKLKPALGEVPAIGGWSIAHQGSYRGWCLMRDGAIRRANIPSEAAARAQLEQELSNQARTR